jgi:recombination endonuclease VII
MADRIAKRRERDRRRYASDPEHRKRRLATTRRYYERNRLKIREKRRRLWAEDPEYRLKRQRYRRFKDYGLTPEKYEALLVNQKGTCAICRKGTQETLRVDHDHERIVVRNLLCDKCNKGLGCFDDDPRLLLAAAEYLKKHRLLASGPKMAITNYSELKTAVENWLDHSLFSARVPEFIALFEATANRRLRVRQQEATAMLIPSAGAAALPADYLAWRRVTWTGSPRVELEYAHPSYLQAAYPTSPADVPRFFTIEGSALKVRPIDNAPLEFDYFQRIAALSDAAPTNWLLTAHPDLYLFGALVEAEMFGVNDERAPKWKARRDEIFDEIEKLSNRTRGAGAARLMGPTP